MTKTILGEYTAEYVVERSRFIAVAKGVTSVDEATAFVAERSKKFYDATHNCFAYSVGGAKKYSDDGEPSGTAGKPILNVIEQKNFENVVIVVTRYFGGVKLGAGGLVRAYSNAAAAVADIAQTAEIVRATEVDLVLPFTLYKQADRLLDRYALDKKTTFDTDVRVRLTVETEMLTTFTHQVAAFSHKIVFTVGEEKDFIKKIGEK